MVYEISAETILIFAVFAVVVFVLYKLFKIFLRGVLVGIVGFVFPWIVKYLNIPIKLVETIETNIEFAMIAIGLFLVYEFFHFVKYFLQILTWPIKLLRKKK